MKIWDRFDWYYPDWAQSMACFLFGAFVWHYRMLIVRFVKHLWSGLLAQARMPAPGKQPGSADD